MSQELDEFKKTLESESMELEAFRKQFNIVPERFKCAVKFCEEVLDGKSKVNAYVEAFGVTKEVARTTSSQFHRSKWVQELLLHLRPDEGSLYFGERKRIIAKGMSIIDSSNASNRDIIEAMKALTPYIKQEKLDAENAAPVETHGESVSQEITKQISKLAVDGKMINESGIIVEIEAIE